MEVGGLLTVERDGDGGKYGDQDGEGEGEGRESNEGFTSKNVDNKTKGCSAVQCSVPRLPGHPSQDVSGPG
jgi:hypothetical protein